MSFWMMAIKSNGDKIAKQMIITGNLTEPIF
jgi:hypothetical protein